MQISAVRVAQLNERMCRRVIFALLQTSACLFAVSVKSYEVICSDILPTEILLLTKGAKLNMGITLEGIILNYVDARNDVTEEIHDINEEIQKHRERIAKLERKLAEIKLPNWLDGIAKPIAYALSGFLDMDYKIVGPSKSDLFTTVILTGEDGSSKTLTMVPANDEQGRLSAEVAIMRGGHAVNTIPLPETIENLAKMLKDRGKQRFWDEDCEYRNECSDRCSDHCCECPAVYFGPQSDEVFFASQLDARDY